MEWRYSLFQEASVCSVFTLSNLTLLLFSITPSSSYSIQGRMPSFWMVLPSRKRFTLKPPTAYFKRRNWSDDAAGCYSLECGSRQLLSFLMVFQMDGGVLKFYSCGQGEGAGAGEPFLLEFLLLMRLAVSVLSREAFTLSTSSSEGGACIDMPIPAPILGMKGCFSNSLTPHRLAALMVRHRSKKDLQSGDISLGRGAMAFPVIYLKAFSNFGLISIHGTFPVSISMTVQPTLHTSAFSLIPSCLITSGAIYGKLSPREKSITPLLSPFPLRRSSYSSASAQSAS